MKKILKALLVILLAIIMIGMIVLFWYYPHYVSHKQPVQAAIQQELRIMSCNLRCLSPLDLGHKSWFYRADLIMEEIQTQAPGIIGFQESTQWQYRYLVDTMPQYDSVITYRDDSIIAEGCPIFYQKDRFTLVDKGSFWLSETPDVMSKDWGAAHYRICSYVILTDHTSGKDFVVFNTHLDHVSDEARIKGIQVVLSKIEEFGSLPAVIMGDLNAEEDSETYESVTQFFLDARYAAPETMDCGTYQNWGQLENGRRIDYFMVSPGGFRINRYAVLNQRHGGIYISDHFPIILDLVIE